VSAAQVRGDSTTEGDSNRNETAPDLAARTSRETLPAGPADGIPPTSGQIFRDAWTGSGSTCSTNFWTVTPQLRPKDSRPATRLSNSRAAASATTSRAGRPRGRQTTSAHRMPKVRCTASSSSKARVVTPGSWMRISTIPCSRAAERMRDTLERDTPRVLATSACERSSR